MIPGFPRIVHWIGRITDRLHFALLPLQPDQAERARELTRRVDEARNLAAMDNKP